MRVHPERRRSAKDESMKKKAKTQKTNTTAAKAKAAKASTTTKGAKSKTKGTASRKAPRPTATATAERKPPKRSTQKPAASEKPEEPKQPITAAPEQDVPPPPHPSPAAEAQAEQAATSRKPTTPEGAAAQETPAASDTRLPPVGTVIQKRDRHGAVRCECEVTAEGIRYQGELYRSLSAAAVAAAKELGLAAKAINGFTFWGLAKPARSAADPLAALERAWDRYASKVESVLEGAKGSEEGREPVLGALQRHARVLKNLHDEVA